jgi:hypothetical protein
VAAVLVVILVRREDKPCDGTFIGWCIASRLRPIRATWHLPRVLEKLDFV